MKKYILTGGPGCGKSKLGKLLELLGYGYLSETPELIIKQEEIKGLIDPNYKGVFPWTKLEEFEELVVKLQQEREQEYENSHSGIYFVDRSLIDPIGYCNLAGIEPPKGLDKKILEAGYERVIFMPEQHSSYEKASFRKEGAEEALQIQAEIERLYTEKGYALINIPDFVVFTDHPPDEQKGRAILKGVVKRAQFVLGALSMLEHPYSSYQSP